MSYKTPDHFMTTTAVTHVLYLHGFRSSPQSSKVQLMQRHVAAHHPQVTFSAPQLPPSPSDAAALMRDIAQTWADVPGTRMAVIGSSLGGFYASWFAQLARCRCVLLNPSTRPWVTLAPYVGKLSLWDAPQESFDFRPEFLDQLKDMDVSHQAPAAAQLLIVAKGDEVLDWREMLARYPQATALLQEGGNHGLSNFLDYLPQVDAFFGW